MKELSVYKKDILSYKEELLLKTSEIKELKDLNMNKENDISYLDQSIDQMNYATQEKENKIAELSNIIFEKDEKITSLS